MGHSNRRRREAEGQLAASLGRYKCSGASAERLRPYLRVAQFRALHRSATTSFTRDPFQYFNTLLSASEKRSGSCRTALENVAETSGR